MDVAQYNIYYSRTTFGHSSKELLLGRLVHSSKNVKLSATSGDFTFLSNIHERKDS
jgi:hypothetical protein